MTKNQNEIEIIQYSSLEGITIFFNTLYYRTPHQHKVLELLWCIKNDLEIIIQNSSMTVSPGDIVIFNPEEIHELKGAEEGTVFLCLQIDLSENAWSKVYKNLQFDGHRVGDYASAGEVKALTDDIADIAQMYYAKKEGYELYCSGKASLLVYNLMQKVPCRLLTIGEATERRRKSERMERLLEFVDENYMNKIRLTDFASMEDCSVSYLSHLVKETLNQSFQEYVCQVRLNEACRMISNNADKLIDVCIESGFSDYRYFCKAFKERFNMRPEEYRQNEKSFKSAVKMHYSPHSREVRYSDEESLKMLEKLGLNVK